MIDNNNNPPSVYLGTVIRFGSKGFGFVALDGARRGDAPIYIDISQARIIYSNGEVRDLNAGFNIDVRVRDRVVIILDHTRPAAAFVWGFELFYREKPAAKVSLRKPETPQTRRVRIVHGDRFDQEEDYRSVKPETGEMTLQQITQDLREGKIKFCPIERRGRNMTRFRWFEEKVGDDWGKIDPPIPDHLIIRENRHVA